VNEEGPTPLESNACERCDAACAVGDNFCRQCGSSLHDNAQLPSVRPNSLPVVHKPSVPAVLVRGAAVVAATKVVEIVARRMLRNVFSRNGSANGKSEHLPAKDGDAESVPEGAPVGEAVVQETLLTRTIHFRR
jgi:hypothetical protein